MINLTGVSKVYPAEKSAAVTAVHDVSLRVDRGEFVVITGRSGSGKTTLLHLIAGLTRPTTGRVTVDDVDIWRLDDGGQARLRSRKLGFIFQFPSLLPSLTVLENVALPTHFADRQAMQARRDRAPELLTLVGLADKLNSYPRQLSAGQQQRVVVARSLINEPQLVLADEPTSDLDEQTEHEIVDLLREVHTRIGVTILLVSHSSELVAYGTRALQMSAGTISSDRATSVRPA